MVSGHLQGELLKLLTRWVSGRTDTNTRKSQRLGHPKAPWYLPFFISWSGLRCRVFSYPVRRLFHLLDPTICDYYLFSFIFLSDSL